MNPRSGFRKDSSMFRILIIDPNTLFRKSLRKIINDRFPTVEIQEAGSATQGLDEMVNFAPRLIFIDIYLPDRSGLDLAKIIKRSHPELVIAVFSRYDSPEYQAAANNSGVEHLISKDDWTGQDILSLVESILSGY